MRTIAAIWLAGSLTGCTAIADLGYFHITHDGGTEDASTSQDAGDASSPPGSDACVPRTFYRDGDGDGSGDASNSRDACSAPTGYVDRAGDCDDGAAGVSPMATEECDGVDQDCDGAIDEGLLQPIGAPIEVVPDLGGTGATTAIVAHETGLVVMWHLPTEDVLRATFLDRDGTALASDVFVRGNGTSRQVATRFSRSGLDQVFFAWLEGDQVLGTTCSRVGTCAGSLHTIVPSGAAGLDRLRAEQLNDRVVASWRTADDLHLATYDPASDVQSNVISFPRSTGTDVLMTYDGLATVDGASPHMLVPRVTATLDAGTIVSNEAHLLRVRGLETLAFEETTDAIPWDATDRCAALGRDSCFPILGASGHGANGELSVYVLEVLVGMDSGGAVERATCLFGATPEPDSAPSLTDCLPISHDRYALALRGTSATVVADLDTEWAIRDVPLAAPAEGSAFVSLPDFDSVRGFSMHDNHGGVIGSGLGSSGRDLTLVRVGCAP